jgi:transcriptional regulator with XRE-family HTH domain
MSTRPPNDARTHFKSLRKSLNLSQRKAAELLNISKNTWIRWEYGQCHSDRMALELLPILAGDYAPEPCSDSQAKRYDPEWLARHLPDCYKCRLTVKFLAIKGGL